MAPRATTVRVRLTAGEREALGRLVAVQERGSISEVLREALRAEARRRGCWPLPQLEQAQERPAAPRTET